MLHSGQSQDLRIGLLGGSFNPAHSGHVHVSLQAMKQLKLDRVVWLVSPQNPLKSAQAMADYPQRLAHARALTASHPAIVVSSLEREIHSHYTLHTLRYLHAHYPRTAFTWLMGADNLANFHHWRGWREIFQRVPVAVFDRAPFAHAALRSPAALSHAHARIATQHVPGLASRPAPAWGYVFMPRHGQSATHLRKTLGKDAFIRHN